MEIEQLRQEINQLLESLVIHCDSYTGKRHLTSLEVNHVLSKTNSLQERLSVLKYLLEKQYQNKGKTNTIVVKPIKEETPIIQPEEVIADEVKEEISTPTEIVEPTPEEIEPTINKPITEETTNSSVADQIQQAPINKLVDSFTLNDRYLYANELFDKDMSAFNEFVKALDNSNSIDEAQTLFNQKGSANNWDVENQLVIDFMSLIERRFL